MCASVDLFYFHTRCDGSGGETAKQGQEIEDIVGFNLLASFQTNPSSKNQVPKSTDKFRRRGKPLRLLPLALLEGFSARLWGLVARSSLAWQNLDALACSALW